MDDDENIFDRMQRTMEDFMKDEEFRSEMEKIFEDFNRKLEKIFEERSPIRATEDLSLHNLIESIDNDEMREYMKKKVPWRQEIKDEMLQYKEETGKNAVLNGMITKTFQNWLYQKVKKSFRLKKI